ncbi:MAG: hypothetical protein WD335_00300 [Candidatus Paceibacterota bacterium]
MQQEEVLQKAKKNLPDEYVQAVIDLELPKRIDKISEQYQLSDIETDILDQEVVYLLLGITDSPTFTDRFGDISELENNVLLKVIKSVTRDIIIPLQEKFQGDNEENSTTSMPVPPPPPAPSAGYGGTSDPYREPTDDR